MIELKVHCDCGQKYKFDVEPVNGQMPFTVACPICKCDGTAKANGLLQQMSIFKMVEPPPRVGATSSPPPIVTAGAPVAPPPIAPPPAASAPSRLRINTPTHTEAPAAAPPIAPALGAAPPPIGARPRLGVAAAATPAEPGQKPNFAMGLLGALIGAAVGSIIYFFIFKTTGYIPFLRYFLALGVGGLTGWLASLLGKGEGSKELGGLAAVFTILGIIGAQYFLQLEQWHKEVDTEDLTQTIEDGGYTASVKQAQEVVLAIPSGTDAEIRMYIAKQQAEDGQAPKLETVSADAVKQFRETELTNYQELASGKLTKEQYWAKNGFDPKDAQKVVDTGKKAMTGLAVIFAVLKAGIFSMIFGAGLAYRLSTNARGG